LAQITPLAWLFPAAPAQSRMPGIRACSSPLRLPDAPPAVRQDLLCSTPLTSAPRAPRNRLAKKLNRDLVGHCLKCFLKNLRGLCKFGGVEADAYPTTIADQSLIAFQKPDRLLKIMPAFWALKADYVRIDV
jgi:hypothetical protein